mmetsp:Transcript_35798/g.82155  ORF Transcript_35798/g.82155 Transcript_35798/m.82155 type:complete len:309 (+) Transcript_35798:69-995(+)
MLSLFSSNAESEVPKEPVQAKGDAPILTHKDLELIHEVSRKLDDHAHDIADLQDFQRSFSSLVAKENEKSLQSVRDEILANTQSIENLRQDLDAEVGDQKALDARVKVLEETAAEVGTTLPNLSRKMAALEAWVSMSKSKEAGVAKEMEDVAAEDYMQQALLKLDLQVREIRANLPQEIEAKMRLLRDDSLAGSNRPLALNGEETAGSGARNSVASRGTSSAALQPRAPEPASVSPSASVAEQIDKLREEIMAQVKREQIKTLRAVQPLVNEALEGGLKTRTASAPTTQTRRISRDEMNTDEWSITTM